MCNVYSVVYHCHRWQIDGLTNQVKWHTLVTSLFKNAVNKCCNMKYAQCVQLDVASNRDGFIIPKSIKTKVYGMEWNFYRSNRPEYESERRVKRLNWNRKSWANMHTFNSFLWSADSKTQPNKRSHMHGNIQIRPARTKYTYI